jgi:hypothetical protein
MWFGHRLRDNLWRMEGTSVFVWEAFAELMYVAFPILV